MHYEALIQRIAGDAGFRQVVESIGGLPDQELLDSLMMEFRQVVERYKCYGEYAKEAQAALVGSNAVSGTGLVQETESETAERSLFVAPIRIELPQLGIVTATPLHHEVGREPLQSEADVRKELQEIEEMIHEEIDRDWKGKAGNVAERIIQLRNSQLLLKSRLAILEDGAGELEPAVPDPEQHSLVDEPAPLLRDEQTYYLYGIASDQAGDLATQLNYAGGVGIDGKNSLFVHDCNNAGLVLGTLDRESFTVATNGMLLLSKDEGMHLRAEHERIINRLRTSMVLIPFHAGVVANGDSLVRGVGNLENLRQRIESEQEGVLWTVRAYAHDERMADIISGKSSAKRKSDGERRRKRFDIKFLEKLLQYQKNLAREVHNVLSICSSTADVLSMIGLASGTSDDWKQVLHSTYTVVPENRLHFFIAIDRLTTQFTSQGVMFEVEGRNGRLSLNHVLQEISA